MSKLLWFSELLIRLLNKKKKNSNWIYCVLFVLCFCDKKHPWINLNNIKTIIILIIINYFIISIKYRNNHYQRQVKKILSLWEWHVKILIELCVIQKWLNNKLNAIVSKINLNENIFNSTDTNSKSRSNLKDDRFSSYEAIQVFKTESWKATTSPPPPPHMKKKVVIAYFIMVLSSIHFTIISIKILQKYVPNAWLWVPKYNNNK